MPILAKTLQTLEFPKVQNLLAQVCMTEGAKQKAAELFPQDMGRQSAPPKEEPADRNEDAVNPFPEAFPFSRWKRISYPGTDRYYLEGEARMQGATYRIHALPGEYRPGRRPKGFDRFLRARDGGGYWVRVRREQ